MPNPLPTLNQLKDPAQNVKLIRQLAERLASLETQNSQLAAGIAAIPSPPNQMQWLKENGQAALSLLNVDNAATARTNVADSAPTTDDDSSKGYNYFSQWIDTTGPTLYVCIDPSPGGAVWV